MYDFDQIIERRHTNAMSTDGFRGYVFHAGPEATFAFRDEEFIRMWVADMDFAAAPEICEAMKRRIDQRIFGYTQVFDPAYFQAFHNWCRTRYDWDFAQEELVFSQGVVPALFQIVELLTAPDEKILTHTPAYGQFLRTAEYNRVELECASLKNEDGYYSIDFEDLERRAADPRLKVFILCNPHNPTGRIWTEAELRRIGDIVERHGLWLISDEIHCDLLRRGKTHIPMGKVMPDYPRLITCMSASKTFNLAGLMLSHILIRDPELRERFCMRDKNSGGMNPISIEAHKAAYVSGAAWLEELQSYLDGNFRLVETYLRQELPRAVFHIPEATYLAWVDMRAYLSDLESLPLFFANEAGVLLEGGDALFVGDAQGFVRLNLAMPRALLEEGLRRICRAVGRHARQAAATA